MQRRQSPREPARRQVEAAPEEVHRARLADEAAPERLEHPVSLEEDTPEAVGLAWIVGRVLVVVLERDGVRNLAWHRPNGGFHAESP